MKSNMENQRWRDWVTALVGVWIFLAPFIMPVLGAGNAGGTIAVDHYTVGVALVVVALAAMIAYRVWEEWNGLVLGLWLGVSPWLLGFSANTPYIINALIAGAIVVVLTGWEALTEPERA